MKHTQQGGCGGMLWFVVLSNSIVVLFEWCLSATQCNVKNIHALHPMEEYKDWKGRPTPSTVFVARWNVIAHAIVEIHKSRMLTVFTIYAYVNWNWAYSVPFSDECSSIDSLLYMWSGMHNSTLMSSERSILCPKMHQIHSQSIHYFWRSILEKHSGEACPQTSI